MKKGSQLTIISFFFFICSVSKGNATCNGEAQVIAKISKIKWVSAVKCIAFIESKSVKHYNQSIVCPIDLNEVLQNGIHGRHIDQGVCQFSDGQEISGVLVKSDFNEIYLE